MGTRLTDLANHLENRGVDVSRLRELQHELDVVEEPRAIRSLSQKAVDAAKRQWSHVVGEAKESRQLFALITKRATSGQKLAPHEADEVRGQLADLLRLVPAGVIAATNGTLPIPGTSLLTPMILQKLNLLPSRWREAHVLSELQRQAEHLRAAGRTGDAEEVEALRHQLEDEADAREQASQSWLLAHWDLDGDGELDDDELDKYHEELARLTGLVPSLASKRKWFISLDGQVLGPTRLTDLQDLADTTGVLANLDGRSGWVALAPLLRPL